jgi:hypothetical protein
LVPTTSTTTLESDRKETSTTSGKVKSAAAAAAEMGYDQAIGAQKGANAAEAATATKKAAEEFNLQQQKADIIGKATEAREAFAQKAYEEQQQRLADIDTQVMDLKNKEYKGYWADQSAGTKIVGALSVALGAYGASMGGGPNYALNIINKAMDDDFNQYKTGIDKQISAIQQSRISMDSKAKLTDQKLAQLDAYKLGQLEQVGAKIGSLASKFGGEDAQNKLAQMNAILDQKKAETKMAIEDKYAQQYSNVVEKNMRTIKVDEKGQIIPQIGDQTTTDQGKAMSEGQLKAQGDLDKMNASAAILDDLAKSKDFDTGRVGSVAYRAQLWRSVKDAPLIGSLISPVAELGAGPAGGAESTLSEKEKQYLQEARNFVAFKLRRESGAAISESEFAREYERFFPVANDTAEQIEAKRKARNREIAARRTETGKLNQSIYGEEAK